MRTWKAYLRSTILLRLPSRCKHQSNLYRMVQGRHRIRTHFVHLLYQLWFRHRAIWIWFVNNLFNLHWCKYYIISKYRQRFISERNNLSYLIQNPRKSSAVKIPGVSFSATSGLVLFLRMTDLELAHPPMKTWSMLQYVFKKIVYLSIKFVKKNFEKKEIVFANLIHRFILLGTSGKGDVSIVGCFYPKLNLSTGHRIEVIFQFVFRRQCCEINDIVSQKLKKKSINNNINI